MFLLDGGELSNRTADFYWKRFASIKHDKKIGEFVFHANSIDDVASSYICQLPQQGQFWTAT